MCVVIFSENNIDFITVPSANINFIIHFFKKGEDLKIISANFGTKLFLVSINLARVINTGLLKVCIQKPLDMVGNLLPSQCCSSRGGNLGREEGIRDVLGKLHQLVGISDVRQAKPENGPLAIGEAAVTLFKVPEETDIMDDFFYFCTVAAVQKDTDKIFFLPLMQPLCLKLFFSSS